MPRKRNFDCVILFFSFQYNPAVNRINKYKIKLYKKDAVY